MEFSLNVPGNIALGEVIILEVQSNFHNTNPTVNNQILEYPVPIGGDATSVGEPLPARGFAVRSYPNPFNPTTTIQYSLPQASTVTLAVYDVAGRWVRTLVDGELKDAGPHEVDWDARDHRGQPLPSGVYFYRLMAGDQVLTGRAVLLK